MGHVFVDVEMSGTQGSRPLKDVLVDTGASLTIIPKDIAEEVGGIHIPKGVVELGLGDGRRIRADLYVVMVTIKGRTAWTIAASFEGAKPVIGVRTLEDLGLKVNPVTGELEETRPPGIAYLY